MTQSRTAQRSTPTTAPAVKRPTRTSSKRTVATTINLFSDAPEPAEVKVERGEIPFVKLKESKYPGIGFALKQVLALRSQKRAIENRLKQSETKVRDAAKDYFIDEVVTNNNTIPTFIVKSERGTDELMIVSKDCYKDIKKPEADDLIAQFGPNIVETSTTYVVDKDMAKIHGAKISAAIMAITDIPEEDKLKIIKKVTSYEVKKGTVLNLNQFGAKARDAFYDIKPEFQIKTEGTRISKEC